jgi:hypothetical protein
VDASMLLLNLQTRAWKSQCLCAPSCHHTSLFLSKCHSAISRQSIQDNGHSRSAYILYLDSLLLLSLGTIRLLPWAAASGDRDCLVVRLVCFLEQADCLNWSLFRISVTFAVAL